VTEIGAEPAVPVSIVVPTWRADEARMAGLLSHLDDVAPAPHQIIMVIPADEDGRHHRLMAAHPRVRWVTAPRGRAIQMNAGAAVARGEWLIFLHVDSRLATDWFEAIQRASRAAHVVGGSYRLRLDSPDWRARVIETGVRLRVRLFGLPYGDQGLFVRRDRFERLGGYRDLPLMEDIDLVVRLRRAGTLWHDDLPMSTSPRRWERDGWFRRSMQNLSFATLYLAGVTPATIARCYLGRRPTVIAMMARAPHVPGKSRLSSDLSPEAHAALRTALFDDTLDIVRGVPDVDRFIVCEPAESCDAVRRHVGDDVDVIAQQAGDLGTRMHRAFEDLFRFGAAHVIVIGSDLATLPRRQIVSAIKVLRLRGDRIVLGPAADGGYYLIGMKALHPEIFRDVAWGTPRVLQETLERARQMALRVHLLDPWHDVDDWADLETLRDSSGREGARTRALLKRLGSSRGISGTP
jgi:rSAM/selenodomain-associated transferase 2/rSAM/selenodomain-associated transferase 1